MRVNRLTREFAINACPVCRRAIYATHKTTFAEAYDHMASVQIEWSELREYYMQQALLDPPIINFARFIYKLLGF